jgi:hypothetical protein
VKRIIIFTFFALFAFEGSSQSIDRKNYYSYLKEDGSINWLRASDAIPIIIEMLLESGVEYHTIGVGELLKINDSTRLVVTVSFNVGKKEYGFLYEASHGIPLRATDRDYLSDRSKASFVQAESNVSGGVDFMRVDPLPENIFLLKQRCYWFQFDPNGNAYPVSKLVAKDILRQDVRSFLKSN